MSPGAHPPSLWLNPAPEPGAPLEGELSCDRAVIGAEPIRWLAAKGIMHGLAALDRRTDSRRPRAGKEPAALEEAEREFAETV